MVEPEVDEAAEGEIGDEISGRENLHGGRTSIVAVGKPRLNRTAVVRDAGA